MNHVQESRIAWENAVKAAKAHQRPLQIWPRDRQRVKLEDLPVLPLGWHANLPSRAWDIIVVESDKELQEVVKIGRKYAVAFSQTIIGQYSIIEFV